MQTSGKLRIVVVSGDVSQVKKAAVLLKMGDGLTICEVNATAGRLSLWAQGMYRMCLISFPLGAEEGHKKEYAQNRLENMSQVMGNKS